MKEQFYITDALIFYRNGAMEEGRYLAAWLPDTREYYSWGYNWDDVSEAYVLSDAKEVSEKYLLLRGLECRPPYIK